MGGRTASAPLLRLTEGGRPVPLGVEGHNAPAATSSATGVGAARLAVDHAGRDVVALELGGGSFSLTLSRA